MVRQIQLADGLYITYTPGCDDIWLHCMNSTGPNGSIDIMNLKPGMIVGDAFRQRFRTIVTDNEAALAARSNFLQILDPHESHMWQEYGGYWGGCITCLGCSCEWLSAESENPCPTPFVPWYTRLRNWLRGKSRVVC